MIDAHARRAYGAFDPLCHPQHIGEIVATLSAIDEFLTTNDALCDMVRRKVSAGVVGIIDQSHLAASLDIFSPRVELLSERIEGDAAAVTFTIDGRLPVRESKLVRIAGRWRYDPGAGYDAEIPNAFRRMADGLRMVIEDLKSDRLATEGAPPDADKLVEEVRLRLLPGLQMLPRPK